MTNRYTCPTCESTNTAFVQYATGHEDTTKTTPTQVGAGVLELRMCNECGAGIENVLTVADQRAVND